MKHNRLLQTAVIFIASSTLIGAFAANKASIVRQQNDKPQQVHIKKTTYDRKNCKLYNSSSSSSQLHTHKPKTVHSTTHAIKETKQTIHGKSKLTKTKTTTKSRNYRKEKYSFRIKNGSLYSNAKRFANRYHYKMEWNVVDPSSQLKSDYQWLGDETIKTNKPLFILRMMLKPYHLTTHVWKTNHIITINNESTTRGHTNV